MKDLLAANRYAGALFEIARMTHKDEEIEAELEASSSALKSSPELEKFLTNPQLSNEQKRSLLMRIYQERNHEIYEVLLNFFMILFEKQRFHLIHEIAVAFKRIADEAQGQGAAEISTAVPLDAHSEAVIVSQLERIAGYKITVKKEVDPALIGGVMIRVKNKVFDGSVKHKIGLLTKEMTRLQTI